MKWRKRHSNAEGTDSTTDPLALVDAGVKEADDLDDAEMASVDRELNQDLSPVAVQGLVALVEPPSDLAERVVKNIDKKLLGRQTAMMCFDLLTTGWHTTRVVMRPEDDE